jgi:hypothetical protein
LDTASPRDTLPARVAFDASAAWVSSWPEATATLALPDEGDWVASSRDSVLPAVFELERTEVASARDGEESPLVTKMTPTTVSADMTRDPARRLSMIQGSSVDRIPALSDAREPT